MWYNFRHRLERKTSMIWDVVWTWKYKYIPLKTPKIWNFLQEFDNKI